jgi:hypothetical protein
VLVGRAMYTCVSVVVLVDVSDTTSVVEIVDVALSVTVVHPAGRIA